MTNEYGALIENKMWDLVAHLSNANVIRGIWIFKLKKNSDGSFERYKAHLVGNDANHKQVWIVVTHSAPSSNQLLSTHFLVLL